jgi:hypothetical protein
MTMVFPRKSHVFIFAMAVNSTARATSKPSFWTTSNFPKTLTQCYYSYNYRNAVDDDEQLLRNKCKRHELWVIVSSWTWWVSTSWWEKKKFGEPFWPTQKKSTNAERRLYHEKEKRNIFKISLFLSLSLSLSRVVGDEQQIIMQHNKTWFMVLGCQTSQLITVKVLLWINPHQYS